MTTHTPTPLLAEAWAKLRAHLDSIPVEVVRTALGHAPGPFLCPRWACRGARTIQDSDGWTCLSCGAMGRGAALVAAIAAGWDHVSPDAQELDSDVVTIAREALCSGLIPVDDPQWIVFCSALPGVASDELRGVFEGPQRRVRMQRLAAHLIRSGLPGASVLSVVFSHNGRVCRPPLNRVELTEAVNAAALEAVRSTG